MLGAALFLISTLPTLLIILFSPMILINCAAKEGSEKAKKASKEKDNSAKAVKPGNVKPNPKVEGSGATSAEASTKKKMASNSNEKPAPTQVAVPTITDKRTTQRDEDNDYDNMTQTEDPSRPKLPMVSVVKTPGGQLVEKKHVY